MFMALPFRGSDNLWAGPLDTELCDLVGYAPPSLMPVLSRLSWYYFAWETSHQRGF